MIMIILLPRSLWGELGGVEALVDMREFHTNATKRKINKHNLLIHRVYVIKNYLTRL